MCGTLMSSQFRLKCLFGTASPFHSFQEEAVQVLQEDMKLERETGTSIFNKSTLENKGFMFLVAGE